MKLLSACAMILGTLHSAFRFDEIHRLHAHVDFVACCAVQGASTDERNHYEWCVMHRCSSLSSSNIHLYLSFQICAVS